MTFALFISLQAAMLRFEWIPISWGYWPIAAMLDGFVVLPLLAYDFATLRRPHRATAIGAAILLVDQAILFSLWGTSSWRHFADAVTRALQSM